MTRTICTLPVVQRSRLSCVWIETGNPVQPLACVWINADLRIVANREDSQSLESSLCA
jgi:hypothetical protein